MQGSRARRHEAYYRTVERHIGDAADAGFCRATVHDEVLDGDRMSLNGRTVTNFGSCMYMGLNVDERLKRGAVEAIERFGPVYSSSPVYTSVNLYEELRERLERIFGHPVAIPTTTTLGHLGVLPVLVTPDDAVVIDHQAHASMHMALQTLIAMGTEVKTIPHADLDAAERAIAQFAKDHDRVWLLADGVYSMFGDVAPVGEIVELQRRYDNLWVYYDDAHGFGWRGKHGRGYVLEKTELNERMIVAVSLSKSFGSGGAAVVFPDVAMVRRVQVAGSTFMFSGPLHPAELGAAIVSADIHLSDEQVERSLRLREEIAHIQRRLVDLQLPVASVAATPIWFVRTGGHDQCIELTRRLVEDGFYVNPSAFPAVPLGSGGVRFTNTLYHSRDQVDGLLDSLARHTPDLIGASDEAKQLAIAGD
jgi:7-keto-8-aminopelargonate synthetase-like enzyme